MKIPMKGMKTKTVYSDNCHQVWQKRKQVEISGKIRNLRDLRLPNYCQSSLAKKVLFLVD
jgi:hypothetical protein